MADRRSRILEAAEALIRRDGSVDFSMRDLAAQAGFSLATSYNLIGTKPTVLYALLNRSVERLTDTFGKTDSEHFDADELFRLIGIATNHFTGDPAFYCPLIRFLEGVPDPVNRPIFMRGALRFWLDISRNYARANPGLKLAPQKTMASLMHTFFLGALNQWVHGEMDGAEFEAAIKHAASLVFQIPAGRGNR